MSKTPLVCKVCKEPLPPIAIKNSDPFCSATCCRSFHGTELAPKVHGVMVASTD